MATQFTTEQVQKFSSISLADVETTLSATDQARYFEWRKSIVQASIPQLTVNGKTVKIHESGMISFYGYGKFPVNIRLNALNDIVEATKTNSFKEFIAANLSKLIKE